MAVAAGATGGSVAVGVAAAGAVAVVAAVAGPVVVVGAAEAGGVNVTAGGGASVVGRESQAVRVKLISTSNTQLSRWAKRGATFVGLSIDAIIASYPKAIWPSVSDLTGRRLDGFIFL